MWRTNYCNSWEFYICPSVPDTQIPLFLSCYPSVRINNSVFETGLWNSSNSWVVVYTGRGKWHFFQAIQSLPFNYKSTARSQLRGFSCVIVPPPFFSSRRQDAWRSTRETTCRTRNGLRINRDLILSLREFSLVHNEPNYPSRSRNSLHPRSQNQHSLFSTFLSQRGHQETFLYAPYLPNLRFTYTRNNDSPLTWFQGSTFIEVWAWVTKWVLKE